MNTNPKLAMKVLKQMEEDFVRVEASLINVQDEAQKLKLFQEVREHRLAVERLKQYYHKILIRSSGG